MGEKRVVIKLEDESYGFPLRVRDENDPFSTGSRGFSCNGQRFYHEGKGYIEQEATKKDSWRDHTYGQLFGHLKHEIEEIGRSKARTIRIHNCIDALILSCFLVDKILEADG
ncbi:MAG: hypothetical protein ACTSPB_01340 [Candidatus Thorarchaeota archaeon]